RLGSGISRSPVARYEAESPPNHMIGRNASAVRIRRASAATSTSPNSQCSVFPLASGPHPPPHPPFTGGSFPRRSFLAPQSSRRRRPLARGAAAPCQYLPYGTRPFAHRRRAPRAAAATALEDADRAAVGRGARGGGGADRGGAGPVGFGVDGDPARAGR